MSTYKVLVCIHTYTHTHVCTQMHQRLCAPFVKKFGVRVSNGRDYQPTLQQNGFIKENLILLLCA